MACIIDNKIDLYEKLLSRKKHKNIHLAPLEIIIENEFDNSWTEKAKVALEAGYTPEDIANAARGYSWSWNGKISEMWKKWILFFKMLCEISDQQIQQIGEIGKTYVKIKLEKALEEENREAIYGSN